MVGGSGKAVIFLSYATDDDALALLLQREVEAEFRNAVRVFVAQRSIELGDEWQARLIEDLTSAKLALVLATPASVSRPWVNFEAGVALGASAKGADVQLMPLCAHGLHISDLRAPLSTRQAVDLADAAGVRRLFAAIAAKCGLTANPGRRANTIADMARIPKRDHGRLLQQARQLGVTQLLTRDSIRDASCGLRWDQLVDRCRESMRIVGWSCRNVCGGGPRDAFLRLVTEGDRRLEFLVLSARAVEEARSLNFGPVCNTEHEAVLSDFGIGLKELGAFLELIPEERRNRVDVRATNWTMAWSAVAVDLLRPDGLLQVELYLYRRNLDLRPELILSPASGGYYGLFAQSMEEMWANAEKVVL
jgi:hypothetical protein